MAVKVETLTPLDRKAAALLFHSLLGERVQSGADTLKTNFLELLEHTQYPNTGLATAYVYMSRLFQSVPHIQFKEPMRPLMTCLILGMKYMEDSVYSNSVWADALGVTVRTVNRCEREFLSLLQFRLHVSCDQYESVYQKAFQGVCQAQAQTLSDHRVRISCTCTRGPPRTPPSPDPHEEPQQPPAVPPPPPRSRISSRLSRWVRGIVARPLRARPRARPRA